jgi:hypothetical protein
MVLDSMVQTRSSLRATVTTGCLEQDVLKLFRSAIARNLRCIPEIMVELLASQLVRAVRGLLTMTPSPSIRASTNEFASWIASQ